MPHVMRKTTTWDVLKPGTDGENRLYQIGKTTTWDVLKLWAYTESFIVFPTKNNNMRCIETCFYMSKSSVGTPEKQQHEMYWNLLF